MPRKFVRTSSKQMNQTDLENAFKHRVATGCSLQAACKQFGIKKMTLSDAFKRSREHSDGQTFVPLGLHSNKVFTNEQENLIEEYTLKLARMFYGLNINEFRKMVYSYALACESKNIPDVWERDGMATRDWYYAFMTRHPKLVLKAPSTSTSSPQPSTSTSSPKPAASTSTPPPSASISTPPPSVSMSTPPPSASISSPPPSVSISTPPPSASISTPPPSASISSPQPSTASASFSTVVTPESIRPFPKAPTRPPAKGRKRIRACILTENDEAILYLQAKDANKKKAEEKKAAAAAKKNKTPPVPAVQDSEDEADDPLALQLDDSSEYSEEFEEVDFTAQTYPFVEKDPEELLYGDKVIKSSKSVFVMEEQLIEYVRGYDHLFNPQNKDYRDQKARREAWEEISERIGISGDACKDTWTKLRNAYTNARKRRNTKSDQAAKNVPKWKYEDQMSFFIPTLEPRSTHGNVEPLCPSADDVSNAVINETTEEDLNRSQVDKNAASEKGADDNGNQETTIEDRTSTPKPKYRKRQMVESSMSEIVNIMKNYSRMRAQSLQLSEGHTTDIDETEMFFLSIASSVKKLSAIEQARVKMEISNMVFKGQIREMEQRNLYQNTAFGPSHPPVVPIPSPSPTSSITSLVESNPNYYST